MNLFQYGKFTSHSGLELSYKIECDALTTKDWECFAALIANNTPLFDAVYGVPRGGQKLADHLQQYRAPASRRILIVDDVLTTGNSMIEYKNRLMQSSEYFGTDPALFDGYVVFDRSQDITKRVSPELEWVKSLCKMWLN